MLQHSILVSILVQDLPNGTSLEFFYGALALPWNALLTNSCMNSETGIQVMVLSSKLVSGNIQDILTISEKHVCGSEFG